MSAPCDQDGRASPIWGARCGEPDAGIYGPGPGADSRPCTGRSPHQPPSHSGRRSGTATRLRSTRTEYSGSRRAPSGTERHRQRHRCRRRTCHHDPRPCAVVPSRPSRARLCCPPASSPLPCYRARHTPLMFGATARSSARSSVEVVIIAAPPLASRATVKSSVEVVIIAAPPCHPRVRPQQCPGCATPGERDRAGPSAGDVLI